MKLLLARGSVCGLVVGLLAPCTALAAGFQTLEQGTWDVGRAVVGSVVAADSAATVFYNPAGMMELETPELVMGTMGIVGESKFDTGSGTTFSGGNGRNAFQNTVVPAGPFFVYPVDEDWAVGFSVAAPFVGSLDYGRSWAGRYVDRELDLAVYRFGPAAAYRVNDWLSLGATVGINYANLDLKVAIPTAGADGKFQIENADQWELSWGLSALLDLREGTRLGLSYFSELELDDLSGDVKIQGPGPGFSFGVDVEFVLPQAAFASLRQEVTEDLIVFLDLLWADFSDFDIIQLDLSTGTSLSPATHFSDTIGYGIAAEYRLSPDWTVSAGVLYASSPVRSRNRNAALPFDRQVRYGAGVRYGWSEDLILAFSYEYLDLGDNKLSNSLGGGTLSGDYSDNYAHFFVLSFSKAF